MPSDDDENAELVSLAELDTLIDVWCRWRVNPSPAESLIFVCVCLCCVGKILND